MTKHSRRRRDFLCRSSPRDRATRNHRASQSAEHRPDLPRQPRLGRSGRLWQRARRADATASTGWPRKGMRLTNFNVEFSCTVSRAALLTGRYAVRTGAVQNSGNYAVGSHDRRSIEAARLRDRAVWQVARRRLQLARQGRAPTQSGLRRMVRHPDDEQRSADDDTAGLRFDADAGRRTSGKAKPASRRGR